MPELQCFSCRRPNANLHCALCNEAVCKSCAIFLPGDSFSYLRSVPRELSHSYYCPSCYDGRVAPALERQTGILARAHEVFVFFTTQKKAIPLLKRSRDAVQITDCADRDQAILRLAFFSAELDFNALIEVEVVAEKVRNEGHQKMKWRAKGFPALIDEKKMDRL